MDALFGEYCLATWIALVVAVLFTRYLIGRDVFAALQYVVTEYRFSVIAASCLAMGLVCGGIRCYQMLGCVREQHDVDEYHFKLTSDRDLNWGLAEYNDDIRDDIYISVYHHEGLISGPHWVGAVMAPHPKRMHFYARRLPNESLIVLTRTDREHDVIFAFDTATAECFPWNDAGPDSQEKKYEVWLKRREQWEARIRAALGDQGYAFPCALSLEQ